MIAEVKRSAFAVSKGLGLTSLMADSAWRRERLLVLCYHGVSLAAEHEWNPELYISPGALKRRLDILERIGSIVLPLDEAVRRLYAGTLPHRAVALTFDDGFTTSRPRHFRCCRRTAIRRRSMRRPRGARAICRSCTCWRRTCSGNTGA